MRFTRYAVGVVISAVLLFCWGFVFWAILPVPNWSIQSVPVEHLEQLNAALRNLDQGTYVCVMRDQIWGETPEQLAERHAAGPLASLSVDPDGALMGDPLSPVRRVRARIGRVRHHGVVADAGRTFVAWILGAIEICFHCWPVQHDLGSAQLQHLVSPIVWSDSPGTCFMIWARGSCRDSFSRISWCRRFAARKIIRWTTANLTIPIHSIKHQRSRPNHVTI